MKYRYGGTILPFLEEFQRTRNIFPILQALDREYDRKVLSAARFVQGDEWISTRSCRASSTCGTPSSS